MTFVKYLTTDIYKFHPVTDLLLKIHGVFGFYLFSEKSTTSDFYKTYKEFVEDMEEQSVLAYRIFLLNM